MSTSTEDKDLTMATETMEGDPAALQPTTRAAVAVAGTPPEVFASFRDELRAKSIAFQRPSIGSGSWAVTAKAIVSLPGSKSTTVTGRLRLASGDFDDSQASISTVDRFATMSWTVVGEIGLNPDPPTLRLELKTNPETEVDFRSVKIVATRVNDVVLNEEMK